MNTTLETNLKKRLRELLPSSRLLQSETRCQLWRSLSSPSRKILTMGMPSFFRIPPTHKTVFCLHFPSEAVICQQSHWEALDELCKHLYALTGITEVYIRGTDLCCRCSLLNGHWVRESIIQGGSQ